MESWHGKVNYCTTEQVTQLTTSAIRQYNELQLCNTSTKPKLTDATDCCYNQIYSVYTEESLTSGVVYLSSCMYHTEW